MIPTNYVHKYTLLMEAPTHKYKFDVLESSKEKAMQRAEMLTGNKCITLLCESSDQKLIYK